MIIRILGEGQFDVPDELLDELNRLDADVEAAIEADDEPGFTAALAALLGRVRAAGAPLAADALQASDVLLPHADTTITEGRDLMNDDGLIPG